MKRIPFAITLLVALALFGLGVKQYYPFLCDDALISLRYSDRFIHGQGLTWSEGPPVEGYSNLLWVLLCSALGFFGVDLVLATRILGIVGMGATIVVAAGAVHRRESGVPAVFYVACALGLSVPIEVWAIGGLEQALVAPLLVVGIALVWNLLDDDRPSPRRAVLAGLPFGLLALTRPDGPLFIGLIAPTCCVICASEGRRWPPFLLLLAPTIVLIAAQLAFRIAYYHDIVPNTAHEKLDPRVEDVPWGMDYVEFGLRTLGPVVLLALGALAISVRDVRARRYCLVVLVPLFGWLAYVVRIGGDIFPGFRHHVPSVVLLVLAGGVFVGATARWLEARLGHALPVRWGSAARHLARALCLVGVGATLARFALKDQIHPYNDNARSERFEWTCKRIAEAMRGAYGAVSPLAAVDPAGCFPYWSKFSSLDMVGLNDRVIASRTTENATRYPVAHRHGDAAYVLEKKPDIIVFCTPNGSHIGCWPSGVGMTGTPSFHRDYRLVSYEIGPDPGTQIPVTFDYWIRMASGPLGVRAEPGRLVVPAHFFTASRSRVVFDDRGRPAVVGFSDAPFRIAELPVPMGRWHIATESSAPVSSVRVFHAGAVEAVSETERFELDVDSDLDVELTPSMPDVFLFAMVLERD